MTNNSGKTFFVIGISLLMSLVLTILPLPAWASWWRPQWVFLVLIFWMLTLPYRVGLGVAWIMGLIVDLLLGTTLGLHAFVFTLLGYFVLKFNPQLRNFPMWQQTLIIFGLSFVNLLLQYVIVYTTNAYPLHWHFWYPMLTNIIFWPWLKYILNESQLKLEFN